MKKSLLIYWLVVFFSLPANSQSRTGIRNVLVVPFERFEFHTELKLQDINRANKMEKDEYYPALVDVFMESFKLNSGDRIQFFIIEPKDFKLLMTYLEHEFHNGHFSAVLNKMKFNEYNNLLSKYDCQFLLTINWYKIQSTRRSIKIEKKKKSTDYGIHVIDYDVFNANRMNVLEVSNEKFEVLITAQNHAFMGVRLQDLAPQHKKIVDQIVEEIYSLGN